MPITRYSGSGPIEQSIVNGAHQVPWFYAPTVNGQPQYALDDGTSRALSTHYADLAAVAAAFPNTDAAVTAEGLEAISMADELAWIVMQEAIYAMSARGGGHLRVGPGIWRMNRELIVDDGVHLDLAGGEVRMVAARNILGLLPRNHTSVRNGTVTMQAEAWRAGAGEEAGSGLDNHCGIMVGLYSSENHQGYSDVILENLTVSTDRVAGAGVFVTSDSGNVVIRNITFPDSDAMFCCIIAHWSAYAPVAAPDFVGFVKHPHDIVIENVVCGEQTYAGASEPACLFLSGARNVKVKNFRATQCVSLVFATAGDWGVYLADPATAAQGYYGLELEGLVAENCTGTGFNVVMFADNYMEEVAATPNVYEQSNLTLRGCSIRATLLSPLAVTAATNATPIVITTTSAHGIVTGQRVRVAGALGNTGANGIWAVEQVSATQLRLIGSVGNGAYTSGGTVEGYALGYRVRKSRGVRFVDCEAHGFYNNFSLDEGAVETLIHGGLSKDATGEGVYVGYTTALTRNNVIDGLEVVGSGQSATAGSVAQSGIRVEASVGTVVRNCLLGGVEAEDTQFFGLRVAGDAVHTKIEGNLARRTPEGGYGYSVASSDAGFDAIWCFTSNRALSTVTNAYGGLNPVPVRRWISQAGVVNTELWGTAPPTSGAWKIGDRCRAITPGYASVSEWKCIAAPFDPIDVTAATNATPVVITTATNHGQQTGARVTVTGANGNAGANGIYAVEQVSATQLRLIGSVGTGAYTNVDPDWATVKSDAGTWVPSSVGERTIVGAGFEVDVEATAGADMHSPHIVTISLPSPMRTPGDVSIGQDFAPNLGSHTRALTVAANGIVAIERKRNTGAAGTVIGYDDGYNADGLCTRIIHRASDAASTKGVLAFQTRDGASIADRVVIDEGGHVGIGTVSASAMYSSGQILAIAAPSDKVAAFVGRRDYNSGDAALATFAGRNPTGQVAEVMILDGVAPDATNKGRIKLRVAQASNTMSDAVTIESDRSVTLAVPLAAPQGGTGFASFTKGDLLIATGSTALAKLAVGANGKYLKANSAQSTGIEWADLASSAAITSINGLTNASITIAGQSGFLSVAESGGNTVTISVAAQTKGKLLAGTGSGVDWLAVGADGQVPKASSGQSTGIEWVDVNTLLATVMTAGTYTVGLKLTGGGNNGAITVDAKGRILNIAQAT